MWGQSLSDTVTSQERPLDIQVIPFSRRPTQARSWAKIGAKGLKLVAPERLHPLDMGVGSWVWTEMMSQQDVQRNPGAEDKLRTLLKRFRPDDNIGLLRASDGRTPTE